MTSLVNWAWAPCCALVALGSAPAQAADASVSIWYRATDGCPDGAAFVRHLKALGRNARLASIGDRIDFLVSVANAPEGSKGRLERQTEGGQLAIREFAAPRCEQVADGLALSLDLALDPEARAAESGVSASVGHWLLGLTTTLATGLAPEPLPGLAAFGEFAGAEGASARIEAHVARGGGGLGRVELDVSLLAGRIEGCPLAWRTAEVSLEPCAALELGSLWAASSGRAGRSDDGFWGSASLLGRARWHIDRSFELALESGAAVPFVRYDMGAPRSGAPVYQTRAVGIDMGIGVAWRLP